MEDDDIPPLEEEDTLKDEKSCPPEIEETYDSNDCEEVTIDQLIEDTKKMCGYGWTRIRQSKNTNSKFKVTGKGEGSGKKGSSNCDCCRQSLARRTMAMMRLKS